ncbi:MAG TPA: NADH-quinone oxidoreductase subunit C [Bryobacteraceae bacterium]|nr:NADH-quinone oxidoreductase subunit C [Bryobacteraceae bacterium]
MIPESLLPDPIVSALADLATTAKFEFNELTIEIAPDKIVEAMGRVKNKLKFERLTSVTGVDRFPAEPRFEVVYHLQAVAAKQRLRLKARVASGIAGANPEIESVTSVYRGANWYERETFDLFGIRFLNHPELTRIMMPEDWEGHPLRKDYPITGTRY